MSRKRTCRRILAAIVLGLALGLSACAPSPSAPTASPSDAGGKRLAPELRGTGGWINSEPFTLESQRGKVVLVDFWTYTCVNCIRTFPHLKEWHERYADRGLVIVGVHTPEFGFERDLENLNQAVEDNGISWPVVQDNDYETWDAYNNVYWPAKYLIDKDGVMRHYYGGEGGYDLTESRIRALLEEAGADLSDIEAPVISQETAPLEDDPGFDPSVEFSGRYVPEDNSGIDETLDPAFLDSGKAEVTSELPGGYEDGCKARIFANSKVDDSLYCESKGVVAFYQDPGDHKKHMLYLQGEWLNEKESLRHARETDNFEDYMLLRFAAKSVNAVLRPEGDRPVRVLVTLDEEPLSESNRGEDVVLDQDGRSFLVVDSPRMYRVVEAPSYGDYELKLSANSANFALYAFTFGVYTEGP